ncbi:MAG: hypothetical protein DWI57_03490 [Chloroflexi bacterium]|nr:MAG: hypothetical protein DWI57_03490 [Chloroflexota bacterium]
METTAAPIRSLPGLAAGIRQTDRFALPVSVASLLEQKPLVPVYQVSDGSVEREISGAAETIGVVADKLRRLAGAYGEWRHFDAPAYFDLYPEQSALLVHISERVSTVHVTFYADLLLPTFRRAERIWAEEFFPAYQAARPFSDIRKRPSVYREHFVEIDQPKLLAYWERLWAVVQGARQILNDDIGFLASSGGSDERNRWQSVWPQDTAAGLDSRLLPSLETIPTVTLTMIFPMPIHRQSGRLRRLRRMWERRKRNA